LYWHIPVLPVSRLKKWRKEMGVEPTRERLTSPTGFEARPPHQERFPSIKLLIKTQTVHRFRRLNKLTTIDFQLKNHQTWPNYFMFLIILICVICGKTVFFYNLFEQIHVAQTVRISRTPRQSDAVKKLQQLYGTFAAYAAFIAQL
jgi:hypothetical protein